MPHDPGDPYDPPPPTSDGPPPTHLLESAALALKWWQVIDLGPTHAYYPAVVAVIGHLVTATGADMPAPPTGDGSVPPSLLMAARFALRWWRVEEVDEQDERAEDVDAAIGHVNAWITGLME